MDMKKIDRYGTVPVPTLLVNFVVVSPWRRAVVALLIIIACRAARLCDGPAPPLGGVLDTRSGGLSPFGRLPIFY